MYWKHTTHTHLLIITIPVPVAVAMLRGEYDQPQLFAHCSPWIVRDFFNNNHSERQVIHLPNQQCPAVNCKYSYCSLLEDSIRMDKMMLSSRRPHSVGTRADRQWLDEHGRWEGTQITHYMLLRSCCLVFSPPWVLGRGNTVELKHRGVICR